ncbi:hypothetical protein [Lentisalinibacter salinarum]|uniref:hypothetical protein n=1 Tax=Lentisalinibacter salinarum TaxID=2992239 RepID=UPI00386EE91F
MKRLILRPVMGMAMAMLLSGCFGLGLGGDDCGEAKPYQESRLTDPVKVPEGLSGLDEGRDLEVPVASTPPGAGEGRCLEEPPPFSQRIAETRDDEED